MNPPAFFFCCGGKVADSQLISDCLFGKNDCQ